MWDVPWVDRWAGNLVLLLVALSAARWAELMAGWWAVHLAGRKGASMADATECVKVGESAEMWDVRMARCLVDHLAE